MRSSSLGNNLLPLSGKSNAFAAALLKVFACFLLLGFASQMQAQGVFQTQGEGGQSLVSFGSIAIGSSGGEQGVTITVPPGITLGGISALTQGAQNLDFTVVPETGSGYCGVGTTGTTCIVEVQFLPTTVGPRLGALVLSGPSGNILLSVPMNGIGNGALVAVGPGIISTVAGNGTAAYGGDGGAAVSAKLNEPTGVARDGAGNLYIADGANNRIRKVTPGGIITTVAGTGTAGYNGDNIAATRAGLNDPTGVAVDGAGNLYIADSSNQRVRKVTSATGLITTVAGTGNYGYNGDNIAATIAELYFPCSLAVDGAGNLYITDTINNRLRKVTPGGIISTVAGNGTAGYSGDNRAAIDAELNSPLAVAVDDLGNLYIADTYNSRVRKVTPSGTITTVAGTGVAGYNGDNIAATSAELVGPEGVAVDGAGNLYISDAGTQSPYEVGSPRIRKVTPGGTITTVVGNGTQGYNGDNIAATSAELYVPAGIALDGVGNLYIADDGNERIRKVDVSDPPTLVFGGTGDVTVGIVNVMNLGNQQLVFEPITYPPVQDFSFTTSPAPFCSSTGQTLAAGAECTLQMQLLNTSANVSDTIVLTDNSLTPSWASQTIVLQANDAAAPAPQTITFSNPGTRTYNSGSVTLSATASSGLAVSYAVTSGPATVSGSTLTLTGAGSVTVQATQAGNSSYSPATPVSVTFTVNPAALTVTANSTSVNIGAPIPALTGTLTGVIGSDGITASYTTTAVQGSPAGTYPITATLNDPYGKLSNYVITNTPGTLTITASATTTQSSVNFGQVAVGSSTGDTQSLSFTIPSDLTLGGISAFALGALNLDFTVVTGGTCASGSTNTTCTVNVQFLPTAVGTRLGALVLADQSGNTLIAVPISGIGTAPLVAFGPGTITTVAGEYRGQGMTYGGYIGNGGPAVSALLSAPYDLTFDGAGNLYIADFGNNVIRKVTPGGTITTVAGTGTYGFNGNAGSATAVELAYPEGVAIDGAGNLYIADAGNFRVRKVTPGGMLTTVAGVGSAGYSGDNGPATSAQIAPARLAVDGAGNLYIVDTFDNVIRKVAPNGTITTVAGNGKQGYSGDGGSATSAEFFYPSGMAMDGAGNLYIADEHNDVIRKVTPGGTISTIAGNGTAGYSGDNGPATSAQMNWPYGVAVDGAGNLYIADQENSLIRKVTPGGTITTIAGNYVSGFGYSGDNGAPTQAQISYPLAVALDGSGNLYIADFDNNVVRKVDVTDAPSLTFASTQAGQASAAQDVTVLNLGNAPLNVAQISTAMNFSLGGPDTTCTSGSQTLDPAANCVLGIEFNPTENGSISGSVVLTDNALNASAAMQTVALQGTGFGQQSQTITFPNPGTQSYGVAPITLGATASSGLMVSYTVTSGPASLNGSVLTITGAGSVTVQASQSGNNGSYAAATPVGVSFTVIPGTQAPVTVTAPASATYGQTGLSVQASGGSGTGTYSYSAGSSTACSVASATGALTITSGTGTCSITATRAADANYNASSLNNAATITINHATASVTPKAAAKVYGSADPAFSGSLTGFLASDNVTAAYSRTPGETVAGSPYAISATLSPAAALANYNITYNTAPFTITPATAIVTLSNLSQSYSGLPEAVNVSTTPGGLGLTYSYTGVSNTSYGPTTNPPTNPGSYAVVATVFDPNYLGQGSGTLTINQLDPALNLALLTGMPEPSPYGTMVYFELTMATSPCPTGQVQFYVDGIASGAPVVLTGSSCASPVQFQTATLTPGAHSVYAVYSGDTYYLGSTSAAATHTVTADTTAVVLATSGGSVNVGQPVTFTATVNPILLDPSAQPPAGTVQFFDAGIQIGSIPLSSTSPYTAAYTTSALAAGSHSISASFINSNGLFAGSSSPVSVETVNLIAPVITWPNPANIVYGTALSSQQLNATAADVNNNPVSGTFLYNPALGAVLAQGQINLTVTFTPDDPTTYSGQTASATVNVTPAILTVAADTFSRSYGADNPTFSYQITGLVNNDPASVVSGAASCSSTASPTSSVTGGPYAITCTQGTLAAANYTFAYVPGTLTVTQASQTIMVTTPAPSNAAYGSSFTVAATASSGLVVGYTSSGGCTNSGATFTMTSGTTACTVIFNQPGNSNYAAAPQVTENVNATQASVTLSFGNLIQAYTGSALSPTVITNPGGVSYTLTGAPQTGAGSYTVTAASSNPNYTGTATGTFTILPVVALSVSPGSLSFPTTAIPNHSTAQSITITNHASIALTGITVTPPANFELSYDNCGSTLAANAGCILQVALQPTTVGTFTNVPLTITDNFGTQTVLLSGTSTGSLVLSTTSLTFAPMAIPLFSSPQSITITNYTGAALTNIVVTPPAANFVVTSNSCGSSLAADASCQLLVQLQAATVGTFTNIPLTITDSYGTQTVLLSGAVTGSLVVSATSLTFATTAIGTHSAPQSITVTNHTGAPLTGITVTVPANFTLSYDNCGSTLAADAECLLQVALLPTTVGTSTNVALNINDSAGTQTVLLSGTSTGAVTANPSVVSFPQTNVGASNTKSVLITNVTGASLTISNIATTNPLFTISYNNCQRGAIAANAYCSLDVTFTPTAPSASPVTGNLVITDNFSGATTPSPQTIPMTATTN